MALRLADEPIDLAETEPSPFADRLGRKKGLKRALGHFRRHSWAGIGYRQHDVLPDAHLRMGRLILLVEIHVTSLDRQRPAARHRIPRVECKVYKRAFKL